MAPRGLPHADIAQHGATVGCDGCRAISRKEPSRNHTEQCRARIEEAMMKEGGERARRVKEATERVTGKRKAEEEQSQSTVEQSGTAAGQPAAGQPTVEQSGNQASAN